VDVRRASGRTADHARLLRCIGFRVETSHGALGIVEEVRSNRDRGDDLVVRAGRRSARLLILPTNDVARVLPNEHRLVLRRGFNVISSEELSARARPAAVPGA
jgi:hypothetical protein